MRLDAEKRSQSSRSFCRMFCIIGLRVFVNLASLAAVVGCFFAINFVTLASEEILEEIRTVSVILFSF